MDAAGDASPSRAALLRAVAGAAPAAIAVSGGVDSLTLAHFVARVAGRPVTAVHAVSPAVPPAATRRVREHAARGGWQLRVIDAGEFADPHYRANPLDRCYFCKRSLYRSIRARWPGPLYSGTNLDDLGDFRPGLAAAAEWHVEHPFAAAGLPKAAVRVLARELGLDDVAELPAQPCLASRVETGRPIEAGDLRLVDAVEDLVRARFAGRAVRCRIRAAGVVLEVEGAPAAVEPALLQRVAELCAARGLRFAGVEPYRRGSAFVGAAAGQGPGAAP